MPTCPGHQTFFRYVQAYIIILSKESKLQIVKVESKDVIYILMYGLALIFIRTEIFEGEYKDFLYSHYYIYIFIRSLGKVMENFIFN